MFTCNCCEKPKSYTERRNLYRHQRKYDPHFVEYDRRSLRKEYDNFPSVCLCCEAPISYEAYLRANKQPKYCSSVCSRKHSGSGRRKNPQSRICICGKVVERRSRYCSTECLYNQKKQATVEMWLNGECDGSYKNGVMTKTIREYLIDQAERKCSQCGWNEINPITGRSPLNVDHIDGDSMNNRPENLRVLCPNCHSLTSTFGSLNMGKGREQRRLYRKSAIEEGRPVG